MVVVVIAGDSNADLFDAGVLFEQRAEQLLEAFVGHVLQPHLVLLDRVAEQVEHRIEQVALAPGGRGEDAADVGVIPVVCVFGGGAADRRGDVADGHDLPGLAEHIENAVRGGDAEPRGLGDGMLRELHGAVDDVADQGYVVLLHLIDGTDFTHIIHLHDYSRYYYKTK